MIMANKIAITMKDIVVVINQMLGDGELLMEVEADFGVNVEVGEGEVDVKLKGTFAGIEVVCELLKSPTVPKKP